MKQDFHQAFASELRERYGLIIPANVNIARDIVLASNLQYLSHESVRKWRGGLATPSLHYLSAITAWLNKPLSVHGQAIYFMDQRN